MKCIFILGKSRYRVSQRKDNVDNVVDKKNQVTFNSLVQCMESFPLFKRSFEKKKLQLYTICIVLYNLLPYTN